MSSRSSRNIVFPGENTGVWENLKARVGAGVGLTVYFLALFECWSHQIVAFFAINLPGSHILVRQHLWVIARMCASTANLQRADRFRELLFKYFQLYSCDARNDCEPVWHCIELLLKKRIKPFGKSGMNEGLSVLLNFISAHARPGHLKGLQPLARCQWLQGLEERGYLIRTIEDLQHRK